MSKKSLTKRWRYLIVVLLGIVVFVTVIPSCAAISSSKFDALVNVSKTEQKSAVSESKSFESIIENLPSAEEIRAMPVAAHPRLLASEERFAEIKKQIETDATMKQWYEKLHQDAEQFLKQEPPVYKLQDELAGMLVTSQLVLKRVTTLALIYCLNKDERYLQRVWQELKAASEFPNWNPSHFLDTAEMTHAFAIGYDWLYQYWDKQQKELISSAIVEKGLQPALNAYHQKERWTEAETNWNQVCNGGIGIGSLAVLDDQPILASKTLHNALIRLPDAMQQYAPDGAWDEGPAYWHYASYYNTLILSALDTAIGTDFNLSNIPDFSEAGLFPLYTSSPLGLPFNFGDAREENKVKAPELFWMAERFDISSYATYQRLNAEPVAMDLIWYEPELKNIKKNKLPLDRYFRDTEVVSMNSQSLNNHQGISVDFKAGNNQVGHSHLDLGTFVLDAMGVRWASDLGADSYKLPDYYWGKRWTYYRLRAEGHNTLVINPTAKPDQRPDAKTKIINFNSNSKRVYAIADLTHAYNPNASSVYRGIALQKPKKQVLIQDEIKADNPVDLWWFMHTKAKIEIGNSGTEAMLYRSGVKLWIKLLTPNHYRFTVMDAEPLETSPDPKGQAKNDFKKLTIQGKQVTNLKLAVLLVPLKATERPPKQLPKIDSLSNW